MLYFTTLCIPRGVGGPTAGTPRQTDANPPRYLYRFLAPPRLRLSTVDLLFPPGTPKPDMLCPLAAVSRAPTIPVISSEARNLSSRTREDRYAQASSKEQSKNGRSAPVLVGLIPQAVRAGSRRSGFPGSPTQANLRVEFDSRQPLPPFIPPIFFQAPARHAPSERPAAALA